MSKEENEKEAIRIIELYKADILQKRPKTKFNEMSPEMNIQQGLKFMKLIKENFLSFQQRQEILHEATQPVQQLNQTKKQLTQAKKQYQGAKEQLNQAKKQLQKSEDQLNRVN